MLPLINFGTKRNLRASFRLLTYTPGQKIWFAAVPEIVTAMQQYGTVKETTRSGVYELDPAPLVDWFGLIGRLEQIDGMILE